MCIMHLSLEPNILLLDIYAKERIGGLQQHSTYSSGQKSLRSVCIIRLPRARNGTILAPYIQRRCMRYTRMRYVRMHVRTVHYVLSGFCRGSGRREGYCSGFCTLRLRYHSQNEPLWFSFFLFSLPPAFCFCFSVSFSGASSMLESQRKVCTFH